MCTAVTCDTRDGVYCGRTLDHDTSYGEEVVLTPRNYRFRYRHTGHADRQYAIIGIGCVREDYPLYYDAVNEKGLYMCGLNYVGHGGYGAPAEGRVSLAQFEMLPYLLGRCATVQEAVSCLRKIRVVDTAFDAEHPPVELHWLLADRGEAVTVEPEDGDVYVYPNPVGVLTNNPSFPQQMQALNNYMHLTADPPENRFSPALHLHAYSRGMGAIGLPGDLSSGSRFVRAAFTRMNAQDPEGGEVSGLSRAFHILGTVSQPCGCCRDGAGHSEITVYTSCCHIESGVYYYTCYDNRRIQAVGMQEEDLEGKTLHRYALIHGEQVWWQNRKSAGQPE